MRRVLGLLGVLAALLIAAVPAQATFPGKNGKIAFSAGPGGTAPKIFVMNPDGTGVTQVGPSGGQNPEWSPDGKRIAFTVGRSLFMMNADGSDITNIPLNHWIHGRIAWAPDGSRFAFTGPVPTSAFTNPDFDQLLIVK